MDKLNHDKKSQFLMPKQPRRAKALPPDPEERNENRARSAGAALEAFHQQTGADFEHAVSHLLANLMHWCDRAGQDFQDALCRAQLHYEDETCPMSASMILDDY
jgi:hypothetical protein